MNLTKISVIGLKYIITISSLCLLSNLISGAEAEERLPVPAEAVRILPIAGNGWAGSSVNVSAGLQNTLISGGEFQYAAFYDQEGSLVLSRRKIGTDVWESSRTKFSANVADAHNTVAITLDGDGYLHAAWGHHGDPLNYAQGKEPGSLDLEKVESMTGKHEEQVTYPRFLQLPDGDLYFSYRDGQSGRGNLVLNRYDLENRTWEQVQSVLISGEGERSSYEAIAVGPGGDLHISWVWRDSPDVATNHDICYARSSDGGQTWTNADGDTLSVPLTKSGVKPVVEIDQNRSLMNPPSITVDRNGRPYIANYWIPDESENPQYHLLHHNGTKWQQQQVTKRNSAFTLQGTATRRPPISRSIIFTQKRWRKSREVYLVYRDEERGGRIVVAENRDFSEQNWNFRELTQSSMGAWEPSMDPEQWRRFDQLHMLVQQVEQRDGNDGSRINSSESTVGSLLWSPFLASLDGGKGKPRYPDFPDAGYLSQSLVADDVLMLMERVADWQLAQPIRYNPVGWQNAPFYIGALELDRISGSERFHDAVLSWAEENQWQPGDRFYHADDLCVIQAYMDLYQRHEDPRMIEPSMDRLDKILNNPAQNTLEWGEEGALNRWSWCDTLFMAPVSWLNAYKVTGDSRYLEFMDSEWWDTVNMLYNPVDGFFARDQGFLDLRERNGNRLYWARGNGWVVAGLARVLELFPKEHPHYPRYLELYREMMEAVLASQQADGLWRPGLLDPAAHPVRETSGSAFNTFALAWGINRGFLDRERVMPSVRRAWNALTACVNEEGKLEYVQPVGAAPEGFDEQNSEPFGVGAFLLAGYEVYQLVSAN